MGDRARLPAGVLPAGLILGLVAWPDLALAVTVLPPVHARLVGPSSRLLLRSLETALARAAERISEERCRGVFADYTDAAGRPLTAILDGIGLDARGYLAGLVFLDGSASRPCGESATIAWTSPGSRAVYLCAARFTALTHRDPEFASIILIHEALHTLGLSENPPSSAEISDRVGRRCRR
jgi:hypothetical protein